MATMKILIIFAHPRPDSLTGQIKDNFEKGLKDAGHQTDVLDLHKIGWSPALGEEDEPNFLSMDSYHYSEEVKKEHARLLQYDAIAFVFPTYWWSMPAILKGYIDRVFSFNFSYGPKNPLKDKVKKLLWLTLTGSNAAIIYENHRYGDIFDYIYNIGIGEYCQIESSKVVKFVDTIKPSEERVKVLHDKAYKEGLNFSKQPPYTSHL